MKLILWLLKKLDVPQVPSYDTFRKMETRIRNLVGQLEPLAFVSQFGNNFSVLDPRQTLAMVRQYVHVL
jgi:hypothetical protein